MTALTLELKPGVDVQSTPFQTGKGLQLSALIRTRQGQTQKLGGSSRLSNTQITGYARALQPWVDLAGNGYLGIGTSEMLELYNAGSIIPISPISHTSDLTTPFTTTIGSAVVTVADGGYSPVAGQWINIANAMFVGGILLQGLYQVVTVGVGDYTILAATAATSSVAAAGTAATYTSSAGLPTVTVTIGAYVFTNNQTFTVGRSTVVSTLTLLGPYTVTVTAGPVNTITAGANAAAGAATTENGGNAHVEYFLFTADLSTSGLYGTGLYGAGYYGGSTTVFGPIALTKWSLDKWGENLLAALWGGSLYQWIPPIAPGNVAVVVAGAPTPVHGVVVSAPAQQAMVWGAYSASLLELDPLLVAWCDVADLNTWTATATNQAGSFRISSGSLVLSIQWFGLSALLWTDVDVWSITYSGFPLVYGFNRIGENCGALTMRAMGTNNGIIAWISQRQFFTYRGGSVAILPCPVYDIVFDNLDTGYLDAVFCASNAAGPELAWWFPITGSGGIPTGMVKWNPAEDAWDYSLSTGLELTAWCDQSVLGLPIGANSAKYLTQFETAYDFDGVVLTSSLQSGWIRLEETGSVMFVERIYPDFTLNTGGQVQIIVEFSDYIEELPVGTQYPIRTYGPYTVDQSTPYIIVRGRGRVMRLTVQCTAPNTSWRYGRPVALVAPDGKR